MTTYTTVQGDMWDSIAHSQLGDSKYVDVLMTANAQYRKTYIFPSGVELIIPDVNTVYESDDLPPWKKVST